MMRRGEERRGEERRGEERTELSKAKRDALCPHFKLTLSATEVKDVQSGSEWVLGLSGERFSLVRRQVRDLCDECPGCLGEVVTREGGVGGLAARRDSAGDAGGERGIRGTCQCVRLRCLLQLALSAQQAGTSSQLRWAIPQIKKERNRKNGTHSQRDRPIISTPTAPQPVHCSRGRQGVADGLETRDKAEPPTYFSNSTLPNIAERKQRLSERRTTH
ncbi:unnamed protein product [Pleuronectes platessa]|uniref:Uncharacterized protein n=1 Tax=Pleuronectes platessa TaxID=8262 RepID=A0A9N7UJ36_PLEPL|nr:unnamed protein product [Pleuronectes platessa]